MPASVTFETKVWENDWELILKTSRLELAIARCHYPFDERVLYINNVKNPEKVEHAAQKLVKAGTLDRFVHVEAHAQAALDHFGLTRTDLGKGYYYSIAELVSIHLCTTDYLLHFSGDAIAGKDLARDWLQTGLDVLAQRPEVKVFNLTWNNKFDELTHEAQFEDAKNAFGYGFSDQMYLVRSAEFKQRIYHENHADSAHFPAYGGELFEKRVDSWLRTHGFLRATYKHGSYWHRNFTKKPLLQKLAVILNWPNFPKMPT